jgi:hypothetical protein
VAIMWDKTTMHSICNATLYCLHGFVTVRQELCCTLIHAACRGAGINNEHVCSGLPEGRHVPCIM